MRALLLALVLVALPALAQTTAASGACQPGARVKDRQGRTGTVESVKGADCNVKLDDGTKSFYLAWMLEADGPGAKKDEAPALAQGTYRCSAGAAGTMRLVIKDASTYADRNGKTGTYTFEAATARIVFKTGPWEGQFGKRLKPRKVGVSSRPGGPSNVICDLER